VFRVGSSSRPASPRSISPTSKTSVRSMLGSGALELAAREMRTRRGFRHLVGRRGEVPLDRRESAWRPCRRPPTADSAGRARRPGRPVVQPCRECLDVA
jgi:hypothetical protein